MTFDKALAASLAGRVSSGNYTSAEHHPAKFIYECLQRYISSRRDGLKADEDLVVSCVLPDGREILVKSLGYNGVLLLGIDGADQKGRPIDVQIHPCLVCITCTVVAHEENQPRRSIGFQGGSESPVP